MNIQLNPLDKKEQEYLINTLYDVTRIDTQTLNTLYESNSINDIFYSINDTFIFITPDYQLFLQKLNQISNIDIRILHILYQFELLDDLFIKRYDFEHITYHYSIFGYLYLTPNYEYKISYLFSEYSLRNTDFSILNSYEITGLEQFRKYPTLVNNKYNTPIFLQLQLEKDFSRLLISFNIDYNYFTDYDISFLSEHQMESYQLFIFDLLYERTNYSTFPESKELKYNNKTLLSLNSFIKFDSIQYNGLNFFKETNDNFELLSNKFFDFIKEIKEKNKNDIDKLVGNFIFKNQLTNF